MMAMQIKLQRSATNKKILQTRETDEIDREREKERKRRGGVETIAKRNKLNIQKEGFETQKIRKAKLK